MRRTLLFAALILTGAAPLCVLAQSQAPILYKVTFPEPEHHWMQVEITLTSLGPQPLDVRMSRSSPGRYAVAEFAKNVFWVEAYDGKGRKLAYTRPDPDVWRIAGHDGSVRVVYKIFGDYPNGTYFGIDTTHARLQMPAARSWAVGHDITSRYGSRSQRRQVRNGRLGLNFSEPATRTHSPPRTCSTSWTARPSSRIS